MKFRGPDRPYRDVRQLEGESPFDNLMEEIVSRRRFVMLYER
jgi:hypothetical protein